MLPIALPDVKPWWMRVRPTAHYLMETEAHVYALAVAASVLLAFFPFFLVMVALCRDVLHWRAAEQAIYLALHDFFAGEQGDFLVRNLSSYWNHPWAKVGFTSMFLLLFTANGIFEPLEVALNRAWGVTVNRPYWKNQLISLGLVFVCGALAIVSLMLTALNRQWLGEWEAHSGLLVWIDLALFLVYWLLPNRKIEAARVAPVAMWVGLALEGLKYVNLIVANALGRKLEREYYVFQHSVTIVLWSFAATLVVLAGAHWTARHGSEDPLL